MAMKKRSFIKTGTAASVGSIIGLNRLQLISQDDSETPEWEPKEEKWEFEYKVSIDDQDVDPTWGWLADIIHSDLADHVQDLKDQNVLPPDAIASTAADILWRWGIPNPAQKLPGLKKLISILSWEQWTGAPPKYRNVKWDYSGNANHVHTSGINRPVVKYLLQLEGSFPNDEIKLVGAAGNDTINGALQSSQAHWGSSNVTAAIPGTNYNVTTGDLAVDWTTDPQKLDPIAAREYNSIDAVCSSTVTFEWEADGLLVFQGVGGPIIRIVTLSAKIDIPNPGGPAGLFRSLFSVNLP